MLVLYRAPFSTNVERVALALAHKGLRAESVTIDYADRSEVERVSGQPLVPVLVHDGAVVADSTRILEYLEEHWPEPPLYPAEPARRAEMRVFIDWFNEVWKRAPNQLEAELGRPAPDAQAIAALGALLQARLDVFAALLEGRDFLCGAALSAADCVAYPFVKYARGRRPEDDERFHRVLDEHQVLGPQHHALAAWIERMGALPQA